MQTNQQFDEVILPCRSVFQNKLKDYGSSWRLLRIPSLTDQLYIKAKRIRTLEQAETQKIEDSIEDEFKAIVNYCVIGLIQLELKPNLEEELSVTQAMTFYDKFVADIKALMMAKNHDYGEAWRSMRTTSYTDMILTKLKRIKQIEDNDGATLISEGISSHYMDIFNYAVFALIKSLENQPK